MKSKIKSKSSDPTLIRFDWAMKRLLRQKANYKVLEGFLSVLLDETVKIINIKDSESNRESSGSKFNRVDIFVENSHGELLIIELQNSDEADYFLRMLYGVSKAITEHISKGEAYSNVRKGYHINIVYFRLGQGQDYVYYGSTEFHGIHKHDVLQLTDEQKTFFAGKKRKNVKEVKDLYPEYYILCVEDFSDVAKNSLDEWLYYFKNNSIPDGFTAPGLKEARKQLQYDKLSEQDRRDYDRDIDNQLYERGAISTAIMKGEYRGRAEGEAKGRTEGRAEGRAEVQENVVLNGHRAGYSIETISTITGLTFEQITEILNRHG
jgi:predicted transposase/invertase (TIGR01784 family)